VSLNESDDLQRVQSLPHRKARLLEEMMKTRTESNYEFDHVLVFEDVGSIHNISINDTESSKESHLIDQVIDEHQEISEQSEEHKSS